MLDENVLHRLSQGVTPSDAFAGRVKARIAARIHPQALLASVESVSPSPASRLLLRDRLLTLIRGGTVSSDLKSLVTATDLPPARLRSLRQAVLSRLQPLTEAPPIVHGGLRWAAAFAVFLILLRAMPLVFLASTTRADTGVQLIPSGGDVTVFENGSWRVVENAEVLHGSVMVRTAESHATLLLNDNGVLRLSENTTLKLNLGPDGGVQLPTLGPIATLVRGELWVLGLLPPVLDGFSIQTSHGILSLNSGSASLRDDGRSVTVAVLDRGATFQHEKQIAFLVTGEQVTVRGTSTFNIQSLPASAFSASRVAANLEQDAVHRAEIAKLQEARREQQAGILPTSFLYSAKRLAEEVDVLFTLTHDGRSEKRIQQADTRLNEALTLLKDGQNSEAAVPLSEYRDSLIAMASGTGDNLVKFLINKQIADATSSFNTAQATPKTEIQLVRDAVLQVSAAIPDTTLKTRDIEGYVLVDKLADINRSLAAKNFTGGLTAYAEVRPYLKNLLDERDGTHPLLRKEAKALLVATSSLIKDAPKDKLTLAATQDLSQYLPSEPPTVSDDALNTQVKAMVERIFIFRHPRSRYNQLLEEMDVLRSNPNRGTLLRRLKSALPEGLGEYVNTEIKNLHDELGSDQ